MDSFLSPPLYIFFHLHVMVDWFVSLFRGMIGVDVKYFHSAVTKKKCVKFAILSFPIQHNCVLEIIGVKRFSWEGH